jgi:archaemetzincin
MAGAMRLVQWKSRIASAIIRLVPIGDIDIAILDRLSARLARAFHVSCRVLTSPLDPAPAFDPGREQFYSTQLLLMLAALSPDGDQVLGVTEHDLYVPVLTFVFGEAQLAGRAAIVSLRRLREEFYGDPADEALLAERLAKEAVHEIGHTLGLRHCRDWRCAMASTHAVERLDLKQAAFCAECAARARMG